MTPRSDLLDAAASEMEAAVDLRRRLHRRPELGLDLPWAQETVLAELDGLDLDLRTGTSVSSVVAVLDGDQPGPTVLLRADMDALPMPEDTDLEFRSEVDGAMHACGHDAHVAMLVGAARLLHARRGLLHGRVVFAFQPGEEGHHGARFMIEEGLLEGDTRPDSAFAIHITPTIPNGMIATRPGPFMASADVVRITVTGRGGHASMPHQALDPIPVACEIVQAIQSMITRRVDAFDPAVLTIAKIEAGTTNNVIPEAAHLTGTLRAVSARTRQQVLDGLRRLAEGIADAHEATATVTIDEGYPVTVNDAGMAATSARVATTVVGERAVIELPSPVMGAEDFSYVLEEVPGAMVFLGAMPDGPRPPAPNHSNRMVLDESAMAAGIALHTAVALDQLAPIG
ncbi:MAG TPA: M20 family metallopeptidase [Acidimicrobiales bacterium]|nr:M20 family metallopeptidase [Acidimicrobiales bacterium]